jgi:small subunit ribosomal protein S19
MSRSNWKGPFIDKIFLRKSLKLKVNIKSKIKTCARQSTVLPFLIGSHIWVHTGKQFIKIKIVEEMLGHKLGEFVPTRTKFFFKKTKKKIIMGQKVNPIVFRIGTKSNQWKSQYFGKNKEEGTLFFYQDFEIRKYLNQIFESNGTIITNCIIKRSNLKLDLSIHFYVMSRVPAKTLQSFSKISTLRAFVQGKSLRKLNFLTMSAIRGKLIKNFKRCSSTKFYIKDTRQNKFSYSLFKQKLISSILKFTGVSKVVVNLTNIQTETVLNLKKNSGLKNRVQQLKLYSRERFFTEALEILILVFQSRETAKLLTSFIAFQLQVMKRHNNFLTFLKRGLITLIKLVLVPFLVL